MGLFRKHPPLVSKLCWRMKEILACALILGGGKPQRREQKRFMSGCRAPPQGGGQARRAGASPPLRASQADSADNRGDPCRRPGLGALLHFAGINRTSRR